MSSERKFCYGYTHTCREILVPPLHFLTADETPLATTSRSQECDGTACQELSFLAISIESDISIGETGS